MAPRASRTGYVKPWGQREGKEGQVKVIVGALNPIVTVLEFYRRRDVRQRVRGRERRGDATHVLRKENEGHRMAVGLLKI